MTLKSLYLNKENLIFVCKIGASIGSFLKDTVENSISIIIFYLLIIIINEIHIIINHLQRKT